MIVGDIDLGARAIGAVFGALLVGGLVKGATGAGAPVIAVPVIAAIADVRLAILTMVVPNLFANLWQVRQFHASRPRGALAWSFAAGGALGAWLGTLLLVRLPERWLMLIVGVAVLAYIALRLIVPDFRLSQRVALRISFPAGLLGGGLQGAAGISAPASISFLNAMRLDRAAFIATISIFFAAISLVQFCALVSVGLMTGTTLTLSLLACLPLFAAMPVGSALARRVSPRVFDRLILAILFVLAARLVWAAARGH